MEVAEALHGKMQYFDELDRVAAQFHGASLDVDSDRFLPLLQRLDDCISCAAPTLCASWATAQCCRNIIYLIAGVCLSA